MNEIVDTEKAKEQVKSLAFYRANLKVLNFVSTGDQMPMFMMLRDCVDIEARKQVFGDALSTLWEAKDSGQIADKSFNDRISQLLELDSSTTDGKRSYALVRGVVKDWMMSEDEDLQNKATSVCECISNNAMERRLDMMDLEWCSPERMAVYIRDAAHGAHRAFKDAEKYSHRKTGGKWERRYHEAVFKLEVVLNSAIERDGEDERSTDFCGDVVGVLRKMEVWDNDPFEKSRTHYTQVIIEDLADVGNDCALEFLELSGARFESEFYGGEDI